MIISSFLLGCYKPEKEHEFYSLIGLSNNNVKILNLKKELGELSDSSSYSDSFYLNYLDKGISLQFNENEELDVIHLYSKNQDGFHQYEGIIPYKIEFTDNIMNLREKIGSDEDGSLPFPTYNKTKWSAKGIQFNILPENNSNKNNILSISLTKPEMKKKEE
jgi:hypothetical protein